MPPLLAKTDLLCGLLRKRITSVRRQLFVNDYDSYEPAIREQESDGPAEFVIDDETVFHLTSNTEEMAVDIVEGSMPRLGPSFCPIRDVSFNKFWSARIGKRITAVDVLQSAYKPASVQSGFGLEIFLDETDSFVVEDLSDREHVDQIRLSGPYAGPPCRRVPLCGHGTDVSR